jgi:1-acyl-sn-glycerol-3-phosphate acyltransferase
MSDWYYNIVWHLCAPAFTVSSSPVILHRERSEREGAYLLAANHLSPYDVACLMKVTPRLLDFVSIVEMFKKPLVGWFFRNMNAFPLDRGRIDTATTRIIFDRLRKGRVVALFPEGRIRTIEESVLQGGNFKRGVLRIAQLANVPILPVVIVGTTAYHRVNSWLPIRRTVYGVNYGEAIEPSAGEDEEALAARLKTAFLELYAELRAAMSPERV